MFSKEKQPRVLTSRKRRSHRFACRPRLEELEPRVLLKAGDLDLGFSQDGLLTTGLLSSSEWVGHPVAVQKDGKVVVAGESGGFAAVARFNLDGSPDTGFGTDGTGTVTTDFGFDEDKAHAVAIDSHDRIIVAGATRSFDHWFFAVARYLSSGAPDPDFGGGDGEVVTDFGRPAVAWDVAVQTDDRIVAVGAAADEIDYGTLTLSGNPDFALARYTTDGQLDQTFGEPIKDSTLRTGRRTTGFGEAEAATAVAIDSSNRIVVAGGQQWVDAIGVRHGKFALARYTATGDPDNTFDDDGRLTTAFPNSESIAFGVTIQPDDKIVAVGSASSAKDHDFALARYDASGHLDDSFGTNGRVVTELNTGGDDSQDIAFDVLPNWDGKLLVAGSSADYFAVARYNANGTLDGSFDDGVVITDFGPFAERALGLALGPDLKIVAGGVNRDHIAIARYHNYVPTVQLISLDTSASETGPNTAHFLFARSPVANATTRVFYTVGGSATPPGFGSGGSAPADYTGISAFRYIDIPPGATSAVITITPIDDTLVEGSETVTLTIAFNRGYLIGGSGIVTVTIADNDTLQIGTVGSRASATPSRHAPGTATLPGPDGVGLPLLAPLDAVTDPPAPRKVVSSAPSTSVLPVGRELAAADRSFTSSGVYKARSVLTRVGDKRRRDLAKRGLLLDQVFALFAADLDGPA
jgi:uncharacterized delta-60 repeat protein